MQSNQDLFDVTSKVLLTLKNVFSEEKPDWILVQGDTTTTFAASLAAYYCNIKIGHIEAGLRTYNKYSPFPEEMNRRITDLLSDKYFAPTELSRSRLLKENIPEKNIIVTGNTVIDALLWIRDKVKNLESPIKELQHIDWEKRVILVTVHRRESFGKDFESICNALLNIAENYPEINIIWPIHLNPHVIGPATRILKNSLNVHLIHPQSYENFVWLMDKAYLILTDSGGIQEEAPALNKPVLVIRKTTERPEGIESGTSKLVGVETSCILNHIKTLLEDKNEYSKMADAKNPYGDGTASIKIVNTFQKLLASN